MFDCIPTPDIHMFLVCEQARLNQFNFGWSDNPKWNEDPRRVIYSQLLIYYNNYGLHFITILRANSNSLARY